MIKGASMKSELPEGKTFQIQRRAEKTGHTDNSIYIHFKTNMFR